MKSFTLRKGNKGQEVGRLQTMLCGLSVDGDFGKKTEAAVRDYQASGSLIVDGLAGSQTLISLGIPVYAGIDVYAGNGSIDWFEVARGGVRFAWVKCSEGTTFQDKKRSVNLYGARMNHVAVGGYHFGRPDTYANVAMLDAKNEADNFLKSYGKFEQGDLPPVLDLEQGIKVDDSYNAEWALTWLTRVESITGVRPMVYCAKWATDLYLRKADEALLKDLKKYRVWWASYNTGVEPKRPPDVWDEWAVWQWTGSGSTDGVSGKCDQNWMAGGMLSSLRIC